MFVCVSLLSYLECSFRAALSRASSPRCLLGQKLWFILLSLVVAAAAAAAAAAAVVVVVVVVVGSSRRMPPLSLLREDEISNGSGIWGPHFETVQIESVRTDSKNPPECTNQAWGAGMESPACFSGGPRPLIAGC